MSVAYQSIGSSPGATSTTCVITKPTGLAVGDLMVSFVAVKSKTITITTEADWTLIQAQTSATDMGFHSYYKVADADDVAATNFTFTLSGSERNMGSIVRIDGQDSIVGSTKDYSDSNNSTATTGAITPPSANCMFILASMNLQSSTTQRSGYSMATSNPTWTERAELGYVDTTQLSYGIATSTTRPETTSTGTFSLTQANETHSTIAVCISELVINATVTPAVETVTISLEAPTVGIDPLPPVVTVTISMQAPTVSIVVSPWSNQSKNTSTFTNQTKNSASWTNQSKNSSTWTNQSKT